MATLTRINSDRSVDIDLKILTIEQNGAKFTIEIGCEGELIINKVDDEGSSILIRPSTKNEIKID